MEHRDSYIESTMDISHPTAESERKKNLQISNFDQGFVPNCYIL